ncbi:MAG: helix-turn-helix domain-containing protein [Clostridia bacterium]|nr:helix-turn-helix domain-containing protein [Clostridia bacterium]
MSRVDLRRKVDLAWLAAFYGGMLTENQRRVLTLHCEEDLSLGEIADEVGISRQAVHETLNRAAEKLTVMEASLGVAERFRRMEDGLSKALDSLNAERYDEARQTLETLLTLDTEEENGL